MNRLILLSLGLFLPARPAPGQQQPVPPGPNAVDFVRDVQPVFKAACLKCHGPERPKGQFRIDSRLLALKGGVSGKVIVPGNGKDSLLVKLLLEGDEESRMPQKAPPLPKATIELIRAWIDQGAVWPDAVAGDAKVEVHWAYLKPVRRDPPAVRNAAWVRTPVDAFVLARLEAAGIAPSPEADRVTLARRLSYDLLGLPPDPAEVDAFSRATSPDAVSAFVDRLLESPHFGERWGRHWLDKARYADSDGYEKDNNRPDAWRYRNWVIDALNADLPFDRFTVEQLAGDLLPGATPLQVLATAFHRQTLTNTEGGVDKEQFRVEAVFDRAETTGTVWLGLTVGCARCHNHKYDAISQQEFYQLFAFFNNGDEVNAEVPVSEEAVARYEADKAAHDVKVKALQAKIAQLKPALEESRPAWEREIQARLAADAREAFAYHPLEIAEVRARSETVLRRLDDGSYLAEGADPAGDTYRLTARAPAFAVTGFRVEVLPHKTLPKNGPGRAADGGFVLSEFAVATDRSGDREQARPVAFREATADFSQPGYDVKGAIDGDTKTGWGIAPQVGKAHHALFLAREPLELDRDTLLLITLDQQRGGRFTVGRFRVKAVTGTRPGLELPDDVRKILSRDPARRPAADRERVLDYYAGFAPATQKLVRELEKLKEQAPKAPVMSVRVIHQRSKDPRRTHLLHRGDFLQPKHEVQAGTLASLHPFRPRGPAPDRLDLATWVVDPENPITPRVVVNQIWSHLFGHGLVRTLNDFGVRGERPTHPELLDWLATEFVRRGWSVKSMIRLLADSATYRQSSAHRPELWDRDPENRLLHRQNRYRVEAEIVRDLTLAASGLLSRKVGGPSVFPPMPPDIAALSYANNFKWTNSPGEDRYRRGMYTFFKRTAPYPGLSTFDCPDSNTTCVQRRTSNTPLQALTMLNNEVFAEAAQALAARALAVPGGDAERLAAAFRVCVARKPTEYEARRLGDLLRAAREEFRSKPEEAKKLAGARAPRGVAEDEAAAWAATARILLNLDEFITRE
jgi:hypothetical protein